MPVPYNCLCLVPKLIDSRKLAISFGTRLFYEMKNIFILSAILILVSAATIVYLPGLNTPFQFDDVKRIVGQAPVENLDLAAIFQYSKTRSLVYLTLALNYYFDGYNVFGYHLINLLIHIISSLVVFALGLIVFNSPRLKNQSLFKSAS